MRPQPRIERVIYWAMYFKVIHAAAREINERQRALWWGQPGDAPKGILYMGL